MVLRKRLRAPCKGYKLQMPHRNMKSKDLWAVSGGEPREQRCPEKKPEYILEMTLRAYDSI